MALRALMKRKELTGLNKQLEELRAKSETFATREAELEQAIEEAETEEEKAAVEESIEEFENENAENEEEIRSLEERVEGIENELEEIERAQEPPAPEEPAPAEPEKKAEPEKRGNEIMNKRSIFAKMDMAKRNGMFERDDVKAFLTEIRSAMKEQRAITGGGLLVPEVFLGLIRENIMEYSKLYKHANVRQISGNGRAVVEGTIPEAVWTDCCADFKQLDLAFNDVEVGCWAVGGYLAVCKANLDDSDIDLASEIIAVLGAGIGRALDKAITFGIGTRMPLGIATRLAQTEAPADYPATARPWADLHTSNVITISAANATGVKLFQNIVTASGAAKGKYSRGELVWVMNETTYTKLKAESLSINAAGAVVAGIEGTMPVAGGVVEVLDFMPDNTIIGGYFDLYLLAEREGISVEQSDHVMFLNRKTVFAGNARYDGKPAIAEGFVAIGVGGAPTMTVNFPS